MSEPKPNVFPTQPKTLAQDAPLHDEPQHPIVTDESYESKKMQMAEQVYTTSANATGFDAVEQMRQRTEEQMRLRDEKLKYNIEQTAKYNTQFEEANARKTAPQQEQTPAFKSQVKSPLQAINVPNMNQIDPYIQQLSQPQFNTAFDVIPLPSEGKLYRTKKPSVRVAYMTTADENILTSPNLLQSGEFLEILINRKLLETDLRYADLHVGDRNAIMLWLRATSYGEMYPVTIYDEDGEPFETEIDLNTLKTTPLGAEPDAEGLFEFFLPVAKKTIKFKLLTVGDIDAIEKLVDQDNKNKVPVNTARTYTLERQLVEIDGDRSLVTIKDLAQNMRIKDANELRSYIEKVDCGIDLQINVPTPRGGSVKTFLPLNLGFFWPELAV